MWLKRGMFHFSFFWFVGAVGAASEAAKGKKATAAVLNTRSRGYGVPTRVYWYIWHVN